MKRFCLRSCAAFALFFLLSSAFVAAQNSTTVSADNSKILRFRYKTGDSYRVLSTVSEDVSVNGVPNHHAEILNRITVQITNVDADGKGLNEASFMTSENSTGVQTGAQFTWGDEYKSTFWRDTLGVYTIDDEYFMPVVRDVPVFPLEAIKPGDTWKSEGHEAHDLRRTFNVQKPYKVPFTADCTYLRDEQGTTSDSKHETKTFQVISVKYQMYYESPAPQNTQELQDYPLATMGFSNQTIWWDNEKGQIDHYTEEFRIDIETARGLTFDFTGTAHAEVTDFQRTATEEAVAEVQKKVDSLGLENVSVTKGDKGLTISIENIQFKADSSVLLENEQEKIKKIASILESYPDNDLLVSGHTAMAGTAKARQELSEQRAGAVAQYLINLGVRDEKHIFTQGFGASIPVASNDTEEGKAKNRRVEITILDK